MSYQFSIIEYEKEMKNYYKQKACNGLKDTIFITIKNTGTNGWQKFKGKINCVEEESNLFFDPVLICEDTYPDGSVELVLNFRRNEKNSSYGICTCTLQLVYNEKEYSNLQSIKFLKNFDLNGEEINIEENIKEEQNEKEYEEEEKVINKEDNDEKEEEKEKKIEFDDKNIINKKFRSAFSLSKEDYSDEMINDLLMKSNNDFNEAFVSLIENQENEEKNDYNNPNTMVQLIKRFRFEFNLSEEDYSDEILENVLNKNNGDFNNAFNSLFDDL